MRLKIIRTSTVPISLNVLLCGQLHFLSKHFDIIAASGSGQDLEAVKQREQVKTVELEMQRSIAPVKDLISLWKLYRMFRREKPDIVHSITPKAGLLSMVAGQWAGVPVRMHTFTGLIFPTRQGLMQKLLILMDRILCRSATHIYPEGQGVKNDLRKYRITDKPLKIIANGNVNGIDLEHYRKESVSTETQKLLRGKLGILEGDFVFIFVGRLVKDKGINELVAAFKEIQNLKSKIQNSKLLLVGPFEPELDPLSTETVREIESNPNIISAGFQDDVRPYFAISDALVFPSYREGFPNVVMQAGAMELPSIVSDINGCNEIIIEGKNGIILPPKDEKALSKAMLELCQDSNLYQKLKENSRRMIAERYEQKLVWEALLNEYMQLLNDNNLRLNS